MKERMNQDKDSVCCNHNCNQGRTCPVRLGTHKPAEAVHQIAEPQADALRLADDCEESATHWVHEIDTRAKAAKMLRAQHARIAELEAELEAIGAGGVEPLRKGFVRLSDVLARLEQGFGANSAPATTIKRHFEMQAQPAQHAITTASGRAGSVYVSGPMTGYADWNFPAFNAAAAALRAQGLQVINPADHGVVDGAEWVDYLRTDLTQLAACERIHLLPGWSKSKGAKLELHVAQALGLQITLAEGAEPLGAAAPQAAVPLFWVRLLRDGLYEGPVHNNSVAGKILRDQKPGEWHPLYLHAAPAHPAEGVHPIAKELADMLERSITGLGHYRNSGNWSEADEEHICECNELLDRFACADEATHPTQQGLELANCKGGKWLTVVYRDIQPGDEARTIGEHPKVSALSWSHALNDRDAALAAQAKQGERDA
jgi:hypothetical protein